MNLKLIKDKSKIETILEIFKEELPILQTSYEYRKYMSVKFFDNGTVFTIENNGNLIAFSAFYANDILTKIAYISFFAVKKEYSNQGVGTFMMNKVCELSKQYGMEKIKLEVHENNYIAINFYKKNGFNTTFEKSPKGFYMIKKI